MALSLSILDRLTRRPPGRPVLLGSDAAASLRARGIELRGPAALGRLLREHPSAVREHYEREIAAGVDVVACLTADTLPRALQQIGMPFRAAALTGDAVELALDAVASCASCASSASSGAAQARSVVVAGVLGNADVPPQDPERLAEELDAHAQRLAMAGCEIILTRGSSAIASARETHLPTWVVAAIDASGCASDGTSGVDVACSASRRGVEMAIFEIADVAVGHALLERLERLRQSADGAPSSNVGFALAAGSRSAREWARDATALAGAGAKAIGGGQGATAEHVTELAMRLGARSGAV